MACDESVAYSNVRVRRLLLAVYLDFVVFSVPYALLHWAALRIDPDVARYIGTAKILVFIVLELLAYRRSWTPGRYLLSICFLDDRIPVVDGSIKARESWLTLLIATLLLLDGSKALVRWTMWTPPAPWFGVMLPDATSYALQMFFGALLATSGALLFKLRRSAIVLGAATLATDLVSMAMSWPLWDAWALESITRRRAYQELPVRSGEVEFMQSITPEFMLIAEALLLVALLCCIPRVRRGLSPAEAPSSPDRQ